MEPSIERKNHDTSNFIDHSLLDNALMGTDWDVVDNSTALPSTSGSHENTHYSTDKDAIPANLTFHNSYFQFVNKHVVQNNQHHVLEHAPGPPNGSIGTDAVLLAEGPPDYVPEKQIATADFLNLNSSFLDGTPEVVGEGGHHVHNAPAVPVHAIEPTVPMHQSTLHDDDLLYAPNLRKVLPHKKRISRKLKGTLGIDYETVAGDVVTAAPNVDANSSGGYPDDLVVVETHNKPMLYNCEICGFAASAQIEFFGHLKEHYEPMNSVVAPTLLDDPLKDSYHRSLDDTVPKNCDNLCNVMNHTKLVHTTRDADEQAKLDQVLRAVELDFEQFQHHQPVTHDVTEVVVLNTNNGGLTHHVSLTGTQTNGNPETTDPHTCFVTLKDDLTLNNVNVAPASNVVDDVEFSDTEDMLEGMRNVVDKVSFEDTCDELDLITSNDLRTNWFGTNNFSDINYRNCDESFPGQLSQLLLVAEPTVVPQPTISHPQSIAVTTTTTDHIATMKSILESPSTHTLLGLTNHQPHHALPFLIANANSILPEHLHSVTNEPIHLQHQLTNNKTLDSTKILTPMTVLQSSDPQQAIIYAEQLPTPQQLQQHQITTQTSTLTTLTSSAQMELPISQSSDSIEDQQGIQTSAATTTTSTTTEDDTIQDSIVRKNKTTKARNRKAKTRVKVSPPSEDRSDKKCTKCGREFNSTNALKYHARTHTQDRPHICDECGRAFYAVGALKMHLRIHTGEKPFECSICKRKFGRFGDLKYHCESIHNDVKAHMCEYCGKSFSRKYSLVLHRKIHTCERNFTCDYCSKSFRASCYLKSHMKIHTGEKPHSCLVCDKKFRVLGDMRRHMRIHDRANQKKSTSESNESDKEDEEEEAQLEENYAAIEEEIEREVNETY